MTSEVEERPRVVIALYGGLGVNGLTHLLILRRKHKCMPHIEENVRGREECMETLACVFLSVRLFALNQIGPRLAGHGVVCRHVKLKGHCHAIWQLYKKLEGVFAST